jgi:glycosyltransferase involved in cell wall biosynthesis
MKKKIAFAGRWSPEDKFAWSGTYHYTYKAILENFEVDIFFFEWSRIVREFLILHKQIQKLKGKKIAVEFLRGYAKYFSRKLEKELKNKDYTAIFVPGAPQLIAYCNTGIPIIYLADASFLQLQGYYKNFSNLAKYNIQQGIALDKLAMQKSHRLLLASDWAKQSAINDYQIPENRISVVPLGANLDIENKPFKPKTDAGTVCRLLFLGVEWERKGGPIVLEAFYELKKMGVSVTLHIVGCVPPDLPVDASVFVIPFLNKNRESDLQQLYALLTESSFLFLPSRAECAGVVFCEASAFGLPAVSTQTGGIGTYVSEGVNGFLLPESAGALDYALLIAEKFADTGAYLQLCASSRKLYTDKLNWKHWGIVFKKIIDHL